MKILITENQLDKLIYNYFNIEFKNLKRNNSIMSKYSWYIPPDKKSVLYYFEDGDFYTLSSGFVFKLIEFFSINSKPGVKQRLDDVADKWAKDHNLLEK